MLFTYVCGTEGRGTRSHHRVCWPYHTPKHMAHRHSVRRRTLENMTEMMILICIVLAYKPRFSCARQTLPVWKHNGRALLTLCIRNASAPLTLAVWNGREALKKHYSWTFFFFLNLINHLIFYNKKKSPLKIKLGQNCIERKKKVNVL